MNSVEVNGVSKSFRSTLALDDVTLSIGPGVTGLLGPNGAGKTTLLRIIATVLAPDRGDVRVLGHDPAVSEARLAIRRRLGYFPQEPGYYTNLSAFDFVDYIAILKEITDRRTRHDEVARVLGLVGLTDVMHKRITCTPTSATARSRAAIAPSTRCSPPYRPAPGPSACHLHLTTTTSAAPPTDKPARCSRSGSLRPPPLTAPNSSVTCHHKERRRAALSPSTGGTAHRCGE